MKITFQQYCDQPAFPESVSVSAYPSGGDTYKAFSERVGLTKLEYFTAKAMEVTVPGSAVGVALQTLRGLFHAVHADQ